MQNDTHFKKIQKKKPVWIFLVEGSGCSSSCQCSACWEHDFVWVCDGQRRYHDAWTKPCASHHSGESLLPRISRSPTPGKTKPGNKT